MCAYFKALLALAALKSYADRVADLAPGPDTVAPTDGAPILIQNPDTGALEIIPARFGLVPHWYVKSIRDWKASTFNARLDSVATKPVFHGAWKYRRCVVPAEAFFEWSGPKSDRQKWRITRGDNHPLGFAGIWDCANTLEGELWSSASPTRDAGPDMRGIHEREPVVLHPDHWRDWVRMRPVDLDTRTALKLASDNPQASLF